jgi:hypothetical protein
MHDALAVDPVIQRAGSSAAPSASDTNTASCSSRTAFFEMLQSVAIASVGLTSAPVVEPLRGG